MGKLLNAVMLSVQTADEGFVEYVSNMDLGLLTTVLGLIIVFSILIIIALLLAIFSVLVRDKKVPERVQMQPQPTAPVRAATASADLADDKELVAVITAAIAASMNTSADTLVVRRIKRVGSWNKEAIEEQQNSIYY